MIEGLFIHDFSPRFFGLGDGMVQVGDLDTDGVSCNVAIEVFRVVEKAVLELHVRLVAKNVALADRTEMEAVVASRTAELRRLGKRMLELDAAVTAARLKP